MNINSVLFNDSTGKKSVTMTSFVWGTVVVNAKLLLSGLTIHGSQMSNFAGSDYAVALGALGAVYVLRRHPTFDKKGSTDGNGN